MVRYEVRVGAWVAVEDWEEEHEEDDDFVMHSWRVRIFFCVPLSKKLNLLRNTVREFICLRRRELGSVD
jgi:hypothetical protein